MLISFMKKYWKWFLFLVFLVLPLGFVLGPIVYRYYQSRQERLSKNDSFKKELSSSK